MQLISAQEPAVAAGRYLTERLRVYRDRPVLLLVSGGSALALLEHVSTAALDDAVTVGTLDERFTTASDHNNFQLLSRTDFYQRALAAGVTFIPSVVTDTDVLPEFAASIEAAWRAWRADHPTGVVLITLGIGSDGHVAGLMSDQRYPPATTAANWVAGYRVSPTIDPFTERVTATYTFLQEEVDEVVGYAVGKEKQPYLQHLEQPREEFASMPVSVVRHMPQVAFFTDITTG